MNENSSRNSKSACGDRTKARTAWMTPNATSSAVTTGGTFSIGSEGVLTPKRPPRPLPGHKAPGAWRQARAFCDKEPGADLIQPGHGFAQNMRPGCVSQEKRRATGPPCKPFEVVLLCGAIMRLSLPRPPRRYAILRPTRHQAQRP